MCSKKLETDINTLLNIVNEFDPDAPPSADGFIEVVEPGPLGPDSPETETIILPNPPLSAPAPNFIQRTFSFVGTLPPAYFAINTFALIALSVIIITMIDQRALDEGWGMLLLALTAWSFIATLTKRWRDTGYKMEWLITLIIPYVNLVTATFVLFAPTKKGP